MNFDPMITCKINKFLDDYKHTIYHINKDFINFLDNHNPKKQGLRNANYYLQNVLQRYFWMSQAC